MQHKILEKSDYSKERANLTQFVLIIHAIWFLYCLVTVFFVKQENWFNTYGFGQIFFMGMPVLCYLKYFEKVDIVAFLKLNKPTINGFVLLIAFIFIEAIIRSGIIEISKTITSKPFISSSQWIRSIIIASFLEEVLYRGIILQKARKLMPFWKANLITSFIEILIHLPMSFIYVLDDFGSRLMFGYIFKKSNSLWVSILAHSSFNFLFYTFKL